jgi:hypothetical protein
MALRTRKQAAAICNAQIKAGRKVLKAKTRKQALAALKKVPYTVEGNLEKGLAWWDTVQYLKFSLPTRNAVNAAIDEKIPAMRSGCIKKHMAA